MLTKNQADTIAEAYVAEMSSVCGFPLVLLTEHTVETEFGWVYFYNAVDDSMALCGNAPFIVDKMSKEVVDTGTARDVEFYIENYRKFGTPYPS